MEDYFKQRDLSNIEKFRKIRAELPAFCSEYFLGIENRTTPYTRLNYAYDLRIFFYFLTTHRLKSLKIEEISLSDIEILTQTDLELYLEFLTSYSFEGKNYSCSARGKERKLCCLRSFYKYFFNKGKLTANTAAKVMLPKKHDKEIVRLEVDEVSKVLNNILDGQGLTQKQKDFNEITGKRDFALVALLLGTGIRVSECVGLNVSDIDFEINGLRVTRKGGNQTILYFSFEVSDILKEYFGHREELLERIKNTHGDQNFSDALFVSSHDGSRLSVRAVQNLVKKYAQTVTSLKKISPHKLRSTFGTNLYRQTQDIYVVADVLGHKDINTTKKHYAAISDDIRRQAANKVVLREEKQD